MLYRSFSADTFIASCRSWKHFQTGAGALPPSQRAAAFARLSHLFLRTAPLYRNVLDSDAIWPAGEVSAAVAAELDLPAEGVDLIARTRDGDYWVVKTAFSADAALDPQDVAAFETAAFGRRSGVVHALLVHDAGGVAGVGSRTGQIGLADWQGLGQAGWKRILAAAKGQPFRAVPRKPKSHQVRAVADARKHFRRSRRGRLVMPCGTGKSLAGFLIAEELKAETVIVAAPSLSLIRQSLAGWAQEFDARGRTFDCLCVCSDETVAAGADEIAEDASGLGVEVTTETSEIVAHLRRPRNRPLIVFSTYHSSPLLAAAASAAEFAFDLAILDEAHKTVGAIDRAFATLLDESRIEIKKRLSMTATERVYRGERDDVLSMDDDAVYGACFHHLSFKAAVEQKLICDYKIITFFVGEAEIRELIERNASLRIGYEGRGRLADADAQSLAAAIALKRVIPDYGVGHIISFHRSIKAADKFRDQLDLLDRFHRIGPASLNLHVSGHFSTAARNDVMERFAESAIGCVSNAKCLTEGIDVPGTDCVLFEGPKQSVIDITQAAGRAMRLFPDKEFGYILVPVVVPEGMSFDDFAVTTQFRKVAQTLTAMSTQDERLAAEFRDVAAGRRPSGGGIFVVEGAKAAVGMELATFAGAVRAKVWRSMARANWRPFEEARVWARGLGLKSVAEWMRFTRTADMPTDIPHSPVSAYRDWAGWGDWLGTGTKARAAGDKIYAKTAGEWRAFEQARDFVRALGLKNVRQWKEFARSNRMPPDIPNAADRIYADAGWVNWGDWLGTGAVADKNRAKRPFEEARAFVRALGLKQVEDWREYVKSGFKPDDIPSHPEKTYADKGWAGEADWIGSKPGKRKWRSFEEARAFVCSLGLTSSTKWKAYARSSERPSDIPATPGLVYASEYRGMADWLGYAVPEGVDDIAPRPVVATERLAAECALAVLAPSAKQRSVGRFSSPAETLAWLRAGAASMADDFLLPDGERMKLSRLVALHLDWFEVAESRGMTWRNMAKLLTAAGVTGKGGGPLSVGTLSSSVWKRRADLANGT